MNKSAHNSVVIFETKKQSTRNFVVTLWLLRLYESTDHCDVAVVHYITSLRDEHTL